MVGSIAANSGTPSTCQLTSFEYAEVRLRGLRARAAYADREREQGNGQRAAH